MNQAVMVSPKTIEEIFVRLNALTDEIKVIKTKLYEKEPSYGSDEWWEWSDKKALKEIQAGKGIKFNTAKEAIKWLNS
ncbi:MAG: hypothetical protein US48_C0031G0004 [Candidatus Levybacteria bacterium GW2011_GWA2_37_36]|nr:MAG: hypothetical protein US43_C0010G0004 [Candidatus Levybacteria bacterium GW2011_GWA1_37_16]KKQ32183.1 MAG: hypothetical protein US48_C0031G0004 [Candidatus Levybacteria bacterium GW2011_GWA2_37_36]KKQ36667.1 MAG: hypothetical protein US55_C0058G0004 [Candidatus Levybacteria bacterium GW2011_GWC2_37_7]KKQ42058.1 MAG: hypothetical protein US59_C0016G0004 [Candidatus Levybacteria bacterium GW2011_GWB1_37_8]OGH50219.1 MAG: hypothetical protein A3H17_04130 [Candidatus Levybacteria bacterium R